MDGSADVEKGDPVDWSPRPPMSDERHSFRQTKVGDERQDHAALLSYANALRTYDPRGLQVEYRRVRERFSRLSAPGDRLRLAMLLMEPDAPFRDLKMARALLDEYLTGERSYADIDFYRDMASFLLTICEAIERAGSAESRMSRELVSERSRREDLAQRVENLQQELQRVRTERGKLQEQVKALKDIEETLRARDRPADERLK